VGLSLLVCTTMARCHGSVDVRQPDAQPDDLTTFTLRIDPAQASSSVVLGQLTPSVHFRALRRDATGEVDVTSTASWDIDNKGIGTLEGPGVIQPAGIGGSTTIRASLGDAHATAQLTAKVTGDGYYGGTDPSAKKAFEGLAADPSCLGPPVLDYPGSGAVLPGNLPPIEFQWSSPGSGATDAVRLRATSAHLDVTLYTKGGELKPDAPTWTAIRASDPDDPDGVSWRVERVGQSGLCQSTPRTLLMTEDRIDDTALYVWRSSTGSFVVIDVAKGSEVDLPTDSAALGKGQPCSGCHRISRDGKRFSFSFFGGGVFQFGTLAYDSGSKTFREKIKPSTSFYGTYATFDPLEGTGSPAAPPAMLVTAPDQVPLGTAGSVRLQLRHPETNALQPSNLDKMLAQLGMPAPGQATTMPDWSSDGTFVVFTAYNSGTHFVRELGDDVVLASIVESSVSRNESGLQFSTPKVLVAADANADPDNGENNFVPVVSPDGSAVAFTRAAGWWPIKTQASTVNLSGQIMLVRRSDGRILELRKGSNGPGTTLSSTWPQWAPTKGAHYAWLGYASERPYGHLLTPDNQGCSSSMSSGQKSCKQLWVMAIDLAKMKSGTDDPSFPSFWIPGQDIHEQYVSPQWTKPVLPSVQ
jgi:hypothetical protein